MTTSQLLLEKPNIIILIQKYGQIYGIYPEDVSQNRNKISIVQKDDPLLFMGKHLFPISSLENRSINSCKRMK